ncbi:hypothetical protein GCM10027413_24940 [Conyzicola nivalis]|uniref:Uncharacterized protein n=1 Tax=Conyzicola nivalis TaxID=1477021 RepID=A0A916S9Z4_9MICO|nr:hypothetical protein [Conyzicola nivalis]GGA90647.1 hypothetical protein GCM10010979_01680 [Conyzicola nivalis]
MTFLLIGSEDGGDADSPVHAHVVIDERHGRAGHFQERFWKSERRGAMIFVASAVALGAGSLEIATISYVRSPGIVPYTPSAPAGFDAGTTSAAISAVQPLDDLNFWAGLGPELLTADPAWPVITRLYVDTATMGRMDIDVVDNTPRVREDRG